MRVTKCGSAGVTAVAILVLVFTLGCRSMGEMNYSQETSSERSGATPKKGWHYLALGDSYTIGESVGAAERFPMQLVSRLGEQGFPNGNVEIVARTGWTTDELA